MSSSPSSLPDGYEVPVFRALQEPVLMLGIPRAFAFILWPIILGFCLGLREVWIIAPGMALHVGCVALTKWDPFWYEILVRAVRNRRLEP